MEGWAVELIYGVVVDVYNLLMFCGNEKVSDTRAPVFQVDLCHGACRVIYPMVLKMLAS